jgi:hypothetical protein
MKSLEGVEDCRKWLNANERVLWEIDETSLKVFWVLEELNRCVWTEVSRCSASKENRLPKLIVKDLKQIKRYNESND